MSKETGGKTRQKTKRQTKNQKTGRFQLLADYRGDGTFPETPAQFASDFRLLRHMVRWAKRYGVLREGRLHIHVSRQDMERNHVWRTVDLARSVVSYRNSDRKIIVNTTEPSPEIFRLKIQEEGKFKQWVNQLRVHRQFGQAKLAPIPKVAPIPVKPATSPAPAPSSDMKREEAMEILTALDSILDKLETSLGSDVDDIRSVQLEYLTMAREAQAKLRALLGVPGDHHRITQWQPMSKAKIHVQQVPSIQVPSQLSPPLLERLKPAPTSTPASTSTSKAAPRVASALKKKPTVSANVVQPPPPKIDVQRPPEAVVSSATSGSGSSVATTCSGQTTPALSDAEDAVSVDEQEVDDVPDEDGDQSDRSASEKEEPPSPAKVPIYRQKLPAVMGPQPSVFRIAMAAIGRDVAQFSLPAAIMEPLSMLQIMCEELEYSELIDQAVATPDSRMRMAYVACFACSRYGSTAYRSGRKPFNPLLGQTFEFDSPHLGWRFASEQVQHHPAVSAGCAEGRGWQWWQDCELKVTYGGNSMEIRPVGVVYLHLEKWNETYKWNKVLSSVSGLLSGTYILDHYGDMYVQCSKTKITAKMRFKKRTKDSRGQIDGKVMDQKGQVLETIYGSWSDSLYVGTTSDTQAHCVWRLAALPPDHAKYYGYTRFAMALNEFRPDIHGTLPKTDSRHRPDQKALEMGRPGDADKIKKDLEARQRKRRKEVEAGKRPAPKPLWFQPTANTDPMKGARWQFNGKYWKAKQNDFKGVTFLPLW